MYSQPNHELGYEERLGIQETWVAPLDRLHQSHSWQDLDAKEM